jgi:hypothetical protein
VAGFDISGVEPSGSFTTVLCILVPPVRISGTYLWWGIDDDDDDDDNNDNNNNFISAEQHRKGSEQYVGYKLHTVNLS